MRKLGAQGIIHYISVIAFVVIFSIVGVAFLVYSRADTCSTDTTKYTDPKTTTKCPISGTTTGSDTQKPSAPGGLSASTTKDSVSLKWNAATDNVGIDHYIIMLSIDNGSFGKFGETSTLTFLDKTLHKPLATYAYAVRAVDKAGNVSENSNIVSVKAGAVSNTGASSSGKPALSTGATGTASSSGTLQASCAITGSVENPSYNQVLSPSVRIKNSGSLPFTLHAQSILYTYGQAATVTPAGSNIKNLSAVTIQAGQGVTLALQTYTVEYAHEQFTHGRYAVSSASPKFDCSSIFNLPNRDTTASSPTTQAELSSESSSRHRCSGNWLARTSCSIVNFFNGLF